MTDSDPDLIKINTKIRRKKSDKRNNGSYAVIAHPPLLVEIYGKLTKRKKTFESRLGCIKLLKHFKNRMCPWSLTVAHF